MAHCRNGEEDASRGRALFEAVELSPEFIAPLQKTLTSEHFAFGDHYDLILEENHVATVSLTTLIGCETDEGVGNDSDIGALAPSPDILTFRYCSALGTFRYRNQGGLKRTAATAGPQSPQLN